jgi:mono/diheme cytochrome c family protein
MRKSSLGQPRDYADLRLFLRGMDVALTNTGGLTANGGMMRRITNIAITISAIFLFGMLFYTAAKAQGEAQPSDPAAYFKAKCVACHGQKAEKKFDASLTDEQYRDAILKGKKPEKPPNMPAYGEKGVTQDQAKGLLEYMKQLRAAQ